MSMRNLILIALGIIALIFAPMGQGNYIIYVLCSWLIFSIAAMGLNLTLGYAGQVSLAQASFMGIGAYVTALMTMDGDFWFSGTHWILAMPCAVVVTFVIAVIASVSVGLLTSSLNAREVNEARIGALAEVDTLENLRQVAVHRLEVDMVGGRDSDSGLAGVPGVKEVRREGDHLLISYEGSADPLIKALAAHDVSAIRSRDDDLEEVFLDLYRDRGEGS